MQYKGTEADNITKVVTTEQRWGSNQETGGGNPEITLS